ncbi:MAG: phospho-N-acetylmuramoyl-pentapeptide-transferase [Deltaproteobacteria bacterium]|nr:phospho-N-acetylmuramoyl-pentapeptide-transferase [Deltaproteobacteria bacterium]
MFYLWHEQLSRLFGPFNVLRYVSFRVVAATTTALVITWILYPGFIRRLQRLQIGEVIRSDGPASHARKSGTPTMGGTLMVVSILSSVLLWGDLANPYVLLTGAITLVFAAIGFTDDSLKLARRKGLRARTKLGAQVLVTFAVFATYLRFEAWGFDTYLYFPFLRADHYFLWIPWWAYAVFATVVVVGFSNAVNLADGLDGLAIGPTITATGTFLILAYISGAVINRMPLSEYLLVPRVEGAYELSVVCASLIGAGIGFLWYNAAPAQVFMGDVGSLSLGATLGTIAVFTKNEFLSVIVGGVFVLEAVSVIMQTTSFKLTGRRVFRMAPIHHHFEQQGVPETRIVIRFWIISILLSLVALASLKVR